MSGKKPFVNRARLEAALVELRAEADELRSQLEAHYAAATGRPGDQHADIEPPDYLAEPSLEDQAFWYDEGYRRGLLCAVADIEEATQ